MTLPGAFLSRPLAHRGLHGPGAPENGLAAIRAAFASGYGCEIDVQVSRDGRAMVFHDETLARMTAQAGAVRAHDAADLSRMALAGGGTIPTLAHALEAATGPLLVELKSQVVDDGALERAVARDLEGHAGPVAVMSFDPRMVARMRDLAPDVPRGLTTSAFGADWDLDAPTRARLSAIADYDDVGAAFISHDMRDLARPRVAELRGRGAAILCWTVRSQAQEARARRIAHNVTFEGYLPRLNPADRRPPSAT